MNNGHEMTPQPEAATAADPQAELKSLRAELAKAQREREEKQSAADAALELARARRALRDEQALSKLIDEHGPVGVKIATVETDQGLYVLQRPSHLKFKRFQDKGSFAYEDVLALVRPCLLHPTAAELEDMLQDQPATLARLANAVVELAGHRMQEVGKK